MNRRDLGVRSNRVEKHKQVLNGHRAMTTVDTHTVITPNVNALSNRDAIILI